MGCYFILIFIVLNNYVFVIYCFDESNSSNINKIYNDIYIGGFRFFIVEGRLKVGM